MDANLKRSIILENYQHPKNHGLINDDGYIKINMNNQSCIDEINLMVKLDNKIIKDIKFDGEACAICTSSTSIMTDILIGKTLDEAINIYENLAKMIDEQEFDQEVIEEAIVYEDIAKQPNRKKCVLLPWWALEKLKDK